MISLIYKRTVTNRCINQQTEGNASIFFLLISLLVTGLVTQTADLLLESARMLHLKNRFLKEQEVESKKTAAAHGENPEALEFKPISSARAHLSSLNTSSGIQTFQPLIVHSDNKYRPILWRKFLQHTSERSLCHNRWDSCERSSLHVEKNSRIYNQSLGVKNLNLNLADLETYLSFAGSLEITGQLKIILDEDLSDDSDITIIVASFGDLYINEIITENIPPEMNLKLIIYTYGDGELGKVPNHSNCLNKNNTLALYISARSLQIGGETADLSSYNSCITEVAPGWFPERKIVGFMRREPE